MKKRPLKIFLILLTFSFLAGIKAQNFCDFKIRKYFKGAEVRDICRDGHYLWFATNGSGVIRLNLQNGRIKSFSVEKGNIDNNYFYSIAASPRYVWAGSTDGLFIYMKSSRRWIKRKFAVGGQLSNWIRSIKYDKYAKAVWIGRFMYLTKFDIRKRRFKDFDITRKGNKKSNTIKTIAVDGDSLVWFGTEGGLQRYDKRFKIQDESAITFYDNSYNYFLGEGQMVSITDILFERRNIWIGTDEFVTKENPDFNLGGLFKFDRVNFWKKFTIEDGLGGNGIYSLALIGKYIWASTYQFDRKLRIKYGRGISIIDRITNKVTKVVSKAIPDTIYKIYYDGKSVWLGGKDGVVRLFLNDSFYNSILK